jgi:hypothetical protein
LQESPLDCLWLIYPFSDILSFYKEELAGESVNRVSILAATRGVSKQNALKQLADDAVTAHETVLQIVSPFMDAYETYLKFSHGYIGFHAALSRYRLREFLS